MNRDRRKTYRVALRPCDRLLISVFTGSELPLLGDVVDLSISGAGATFSVQPPPLPLGEQVRISLSTRGGPRPVELEALVATRSDENRVRRYGFEFLGRSALEDGMSKRLFRLFNRRGQVRIPLEGCPAAVRAEGAKVPKTYKVELHDVSVGGVALLIPKEAERELRSAVEMQVRFRLPGQERTFQVVGRIRSRRATAAGVIFGLEMDATRIRHFDQVKERLMQFIRVREREILIDGDGTEQAA